MLSLVALHGTQGVGDMKFTHYFLCTRRREDRKDIHMEWIERVVANPL